MIVKTFLTKLRIAFSEPERVWGWLKRKIAIFVHRWQQAGVDKNISSAEIIDAHIPELVSVILPVYNQADFLDGSIQSVLNQSYRDIELIIVNDGSTDGVERVLDRYVHDPRVKVLTQENQKLPKALSNGFAEARGEFYTWTSSDNYYRPGAIAEMVAFLQKNRDVQVTYCDYIVIGDDGKPLFDSDFRPHNQDRQNSSHIHLPETTEQLNFIKDNFIGGCFMYRSWVGKVIGEYDPTLGIEDYDYWMRINRQFIIRHIDNTKLLYEYRWHAQSLSQRAEEFQIFDKAENLMLYEKLRTEFYKKEFHVFQGESASACLKDGYDKKILFLDRAENPDVSDPNTFMVSIENGELDFFDLSPVLYEHCELIITNQEYNFDLLSAYFPEKTFFLADAADNHDFVRKVANNRIFYQQTKPLELRQRNRPELYHTGKVNLMVLVDSFDTGGLEQLIYDLVVNIDKEQFNLIICCESGGYNADRCVQEKIPVIILPTEPQEKEAVFRQVLRDYRIEVINHHHGTFGLKLAKKEFGIRIVAYIHNTYCWFGEIEKFNFTKNSIYIDLFIAVSKNVAAYTNRHFQIPFRKIQVVPNGIDVNKHKGNLQWQLKFSRTDLGFAEEDFIMLNVASFHEIKAHKLLFQVMANLKKEHPQIKLLCVGNIFNGGYYQEIKNLLTEMGLQETVLLQDFSEDIWNYYRIADCFILPSFYEGWSLAMTEAMYYSLPLILSDVGASRDVIENEDIGLVVANPFGSILDLEQEKLYKLVAQDNFQNADNFTAAILRMYKERQYWQAAGKLGHKKVAAYYNFENVISALQKVL